MNVGRSDDPTMTPTSHPHEVEVPSASLTAPAVRPPRWSGKKTAVAAALAITFASAGTLTAAAAMPSGTGSQAGQASQMGGPGGPGGRMNWQPGQSGVAQQGPGGQSTTGGQLPGLSDPTRQQGATGSGGPATSDTSTI